MTYRCPGNDPNRARDVQTPDEVRAMITGAGADGFQAENRYAGAPPAEPSPDEKMVWLDCNERTLTESRRLAEREGRCATCGLRDHCYCDQPCAFCKFPPMRPRAPQAEVS